MRALHRRLDNRSIYLHFVSDILNEGRFDDARFYVREDVITHGGPPGQEAGLAGFIAALKRLRSAFPDLTAVATQIVAEGDQVVGRFEVRGTHRGDYLGIAPTGKPVEYEEIAIVRLAGGRIAEHWAVADAKTLLNQIGAPPSGAAA
jgi:predicted ester cyclase